MPVSSQPADAGGVLPPPPRRRAKQRRQKPRLTAEAIVDAALRVIDAEGVDALSMRRVADDLGTGPASLYQHVADKEELLDLVFDRVVGEIPVPGPPDPARWQEQIKDLARDMAAVFRRHRDVARIAIARVPTGEQALERSNAILGVLLAGGIDDQTAAFAIDLISLFVVATSYEQAVWAARAEGDGPPDVTAFAVELRAYFERLPPDRFPHLVALAGPLTAGGDDDPDERFEFGLDVIVGGIAARASRMR